MNKNHLIVFLIPVLVLIVGLFVLVYFGVWDWSTKINTGQVFEIIVLTVLVMATIFYAIRTSDIAQTTEKQAQATEEQAQATKEQADASVKMAKEMKEQRYETVRPVVDIKRDTAKADLDRRTLEALAASSEEAANGLSCILHNIGLGPAIDLRSFIQTPTPPHERRPWEFGTLASGGKTERMNLSLRDEDDRMALVVYYKDVHGRTFESSREVSIDKEKGWQLGPLQIRLLEEE